MIGTPTNDWRSWAAGQALEAYTNIKDQGTAYPDEPTEDRLADMLCDLMHFADRNLEDDGQTFKQLLERARMNYEEEKEEEE